MAKETYNIGELYFGVKNNGDVIGQQITDETMRDVSQGIRNHLKPAIYPVIDKEHYGDKTVISVKFAGTEQPYLAYNIPVLGWRMKTLSWSSPCMRR